MLTLYFDILRDIRRLAEQNAEIVASEDSRASLRRSDGISTTSTSTQSRAT